MASTSKVRSEASDLRGDVLDEVGEETLELFRENDAYTEFLWSSLLKLSDRPLSGRVLEVGCGIGNLTRILLRSDDVTFLHALDLDPAYVERVKDDVSDPRLETTAVPAERFFPGEGDCRSEYGTPEGGFDTIVSTNVLEHIEDDGQVMKNFRSMLRPQGRILLLVPAHQALFSDLDRNLSHFRRYSTAGFRRLAETSGLSLVGARYFNPLGAFGWWLNGKVLRRGVLPSGQLAAYTRFAIPLSKLLDRINPLPFGVSVIGVFCRDSTD